MALRQTLADVIEPLIFERLHPKAQKIARESKIPKNAYIALQIPKNESKRDGTGRWIQEHTAGIMWLNLDDQPDQKSILEDQVTNRYGKIIHYGNFPSHDHPSEAVRKKYKLYGEGEAENPWDRMAQYCDIQLGSVKEINSRYNLLEQAIADQKARAEALEAENKALKDAIEEKLANAKPNKKEAKNDAV